MNPDGKEVMTMDTSTQFQLGLAREHQAREIAHAARMRLSDRATPSLRRTVGYTIMRIGARLAAEPSIELARSR
jgi:hypothetical protein